MKVQKQVVSGKAGNPKPSKVMGSKKYRHLSFVAHRGYVLPLVIILSLVMMTAVSVWYRQVVLQSFLSERLILQRAIYQECWSLLPLLREKLDSSTAEELTSGDDKFFSLAYSGNVIWSISRSALQGGKLTLTFTNQDPKLEPVVLVIAYSR